MYQLNNNCDRVELLRSRGLNPIPGKEESQPFSGNFYYEAPCLDIDRAETSHTILGFGASLTDASCYLFSRMTPENRKKIFDELFSPDKLNLSIGRLNVGASDYATIAYSYDDGDEDMELKNFSIGHDRKWIIPTVREVLALRPDMYIFSSPWSPPGWMKTSKTMCGGYMRAKYLPVFADYLVKYLLAYRECGIDIHALTMQNEPDTDQRGTMPQSLLHPDFEAELVAHLMPPRLKAAGLDTKLWLHDHNYNGYLRILNILSEPGVLENIDAVAVHPYSGNPAMLDPIREKYPHIRFQLTEMGPSLKKDTPRNFTSWWSNIILEALNHGCSSFVGWNYILDEHGCPNLGNFDCGGLLEVNSETGEVTPSTLYYAFQHLAPYVKKGAGLLIPPINTALPEKASCSIFRNPDQSLYAVAGNDNDHILTLQFKYRSKYLKLLLPPKSMTTVKLSD